MRTVNTDETCSRSMSYFRAMNVTCNKAEQISGQSTWLWKWRYLCASFLSFPLWQMVIQFAMEWGERNETRQLSSTWLRMIIKRKKERNKRKTVNSCSRSLDTWIVTCLPVVWVSRSLHVDWFVSWSDSSRRKEEIQIACVTGILFRVTRTPDEQPESRWSFSPCECVFLSTHTLRHLHHLWHCKRGEMFLVCKYHIIIVIWPSQCLSLPPHSESLFCKWIIVSSKTAGALITLVKLLDNRLGFFFLFSPSFHLRVFGSHLLFIRQQWVNWIGREERRQPVKGHLSFATRSML